MRHQHIVFVLRVRQEKEHYEEGLKNLRDYFAETQENLTGEEKEELDKIRPFYTITVTALRKFELNDSLNQRDEYKR